MGENFNILTFDAKYISGADLKGADVTLTIERVDKKTVRSAISNEEGPAAVIYFVGRERGYIPNKTSRKVIAKLYGAEVDGLVGKRITIYPVPATYKGEPTIGIRVRPVIPPEEKKGAA